MDTNNFILNSEWATFKEDSSGTVFSITIPNGLVFNPSSPILATQTLSVGRINAGIRAQSTTTKYTGISVGASLVTNINVTIAGSPTTATLYCTLRRTSPNELTLRVEVEGFTGAPNNITTESVTINFYVSTYLSPFDN